MTRDRESSLTSELRRHLAGTSHLELFEQAVDLDRQIAQHMPTATFLLWHADVALASVAAQRLVDLDRETRRATAIADGLPAETRPIRIGAAGLQIADAAPGSLDLILVGLGLTSTVLLSQPVQLLLTVQALLDDVGRVRAWLRRRQEAPQEAAQRIEQLRAELALLRSEVAAGDEEAPEAVIEDGRIAVRGPTRITLVRRYADGSSDYVDFDGRR